MPKILIPLPLYGFDPTEAAIPATIFARQGLELIFATPNGQMAAPDARMLRGENLGIWKPFLSARKDAVDAYQNLQHTPAFQQPIAYEQIQTADIQGIFLPGGHDKAIRPYLESQLLQTIIADFFARQKPVAAICHGTLLVGRSQVPETGKSVLYGYKTTGLLQSQEKLAYQLTRWWLGDYYLTYPNTTVEAELKTYLQTPTDFIAGKLPLLRDTPTHLDRGFALKDRNYLSARWPGDVYNLAFEFLKMF